MVLENVLDFHIIDIHSFTELENDNLMFVRFISVYVIRPPII